MEIECKDNYKNNYYEESSKAVHRSSIKKKILIYILFLAIIILSIIFVKNYVFDNAPIKELQNSTHLNESLSSNNGEFESYPFLNYKNKKQTLISDGNNLYVFDLETKVTVLIKEISNITTFDTYLNEGLCWSEVRESKIKCLWKKKLSDISLSKRCVPQAIAIDFIAEKVYIIDNFAGTLIVADMDGKNYGIMLSNLITPRDIALDPYEEVAFVVQLNSILKISMDGNLLKEIMQDIGVNVITVDRAAKRIYWSVNYNVEGIISTDYDGQNRIFMASTTKVESLTIVDNQLFWLRPAMWNSNATLLSCEVDRMKDVCVNEIEHKLTFVNLKIIKAFFDQSSIPINNPCKKSKCSQLCLLNSSGAGFKCACKIGWQINADLTTCRRIDSFLLYSQGNFLKGRLLDDTKTTFTDVFPPIPFKTDSLVLKETINFDYDLKNDSIYISDDKKIYILNMIKDGDQQLIYTSPDFIKDIAIDWITGLLYYIIEDLSKSHSQLKVIDVNPRKKMNDLVFDMSKDSTYNEDIEEQSIVLYPNMRYLFYISNNLYLRTHGVNIIYMIVKKLKLTNCSSGYKVEKETNYLVTSNPHGPNPVNLAIDYEEDSMHFFNLEDGIFDTDINIKYPKKRIAFINNFNNSMKISIYRNKIYYSNLTSIWSTDKRTGANAKELVKSKLIGNTVEKISGVRIVSEVIQSIHNNLCPT